MRSATSWFLLLATSWLAPTANCAEPAPAFPKETIGTSQIRLLPRAANGRDYQLYVSLPFSYGSEPGKRYPVLYACDGYWSFVLLCGMYGGLYYDGAVPEYILVGLGYAGENPDYGTLRLYDYLPAPLADDPAAQRSGHAAEFLAVLEKEIIPFIEGEYRVDPSFRALAGGSAGGLFTLYTLFERPELFQGYIAVSPSAGKHTGLLAHEERFARSDRRLNARLFMSGASEEQPDFLKDIQAFDRVLTNRDYPGLSYRWRLVEGQGHGGTGAESFSHGIPFVFRPVLKREDPKR